MKYPYTDEQHILILIALLKEHGVTQVIASPGSANSSFVVSLQNDPDFTLYSVVDERSAAYVACGIATETNQPVIITCTGATASRNYFPALTEAFYRKLPILAITATQELSKVGHHIAQVIDRSRMPVDTFKLSLNLPIIKDSDDIWDCEVKVNKAILELVRNGGGPVHLNMPTSRGTFNAVEHLPKVRTIRRIRLHDTHPQLPDANIGIFIGAHPEFSDELANAVGEFCQKSGATVFCDHTSNYKGPNRLLSSLIASQDKLAKDIYRPNLLIHLGEITGDYSIFKIHANEVWRVSEDGEIRDTFRRLSYIFEMREIDFFSYYAKERIVPKSYFLDIAAHSNKLQKMIPDLPISNIWIASRLASRIPENSTVHFAILNSLRAWNFFEMPASVKSSANVGGFGIDGNLSTLVGASFTCQERLFFCIIGDLAFFYDMNILGNRHIGKNIRILLINNGKGAEFLTYKHRNATLGTDADDFVAASGHNGQKSVTLVRNFAEALGFKYMFAESKEEFCSIQDSFLNSEICDKPILFEVFTNSDDEHEAQAIICNIIEPNGGI
jgi:2-succinyl-5-enolpyruvyl-6-hydroxy-3-cyclohexene-1-carboxylate synthase